MLRLVAVSSLFLNTANAATSSNKQCYGPDYTEIFPFIGIPNDICTHAYYNSSDTHSLAVTLSYGTTVFGQQTFTDQDPSYDEKTICDPSFPSPLEIMHACSLCLGFDDVFLSDKWAKICPKYILHCKNPMGQPMHQEYPQPCFTVGDEDSDDIAQIVGGNTDFAFKLLSSNALTQDIVTDLFVSPFSITNALIMTMMAANGETLKQLMNAFELTTDDYDIFDSFDTLVQTLQHKTDDVVNTIDNKLWINNAWYKVISPPFLKDFARFGNIEGCNFRNDSYIETQRIDAEVEQSTWNKIKHPLANKNLSANTVMLFTNTMYFKGHWQFPFTKAISKTFTDDNKEEIKVEMMQTDLAKFNTFVDSDVEVIELPFADDFSEISFIMIRPTLQKYVADGPASTIEFEKALDRTLLQKWLSSLTQETVASTVTLPVLEMYNMEDITSSLEALGIVDVFSAQKADLKNMTTKHYQVFETNLNRQDYIQITQNGVEAASLVTDGDDGKDDTNQGPVQHADRPFLFLIMDRSVDLILYAGRVTNPKGWTTDDHGGSSGKSESKIGAIIGYMLLVIVVAYFIIKYAYNRLVMRASGVEAIPHAGQCIACMDFCNGKIESLYQGRRRRSSGRERYAELMNDNMTL
eukprot:898887_1